MNKHWEYDNGIYKLYFTQFYEDELVAELQYSEDQEGWIANVNMYFKYKEEEWLADDELSVDDAKELVEDMIIMHIKEEIDYYKDMLEKFVDKD